MTRPSMLFLVLAAAACSKSGSGDAATTWVDLHPLPLQIRMPAGATAGQLDAPRPQPKGMQVSARECVVAVFPAERRDVATFQAEIKQREPTATFTRVRAPEAGDAQILVNYDYEHAAAGAAPAKRTSFRFTTTIGAASYDCEPFAYRSDLACEEAACRSLRPK